MDDRWQFSRWFGSVRAPSPSFPALTPGADRPRSTVAILRAGTLSFTARTTTGAFIGSTHDASGMVEGGLADAHGWVEALVATLATGNELRDRDMRIALEADRHPTIRFDLARVELLLDADDRDDSVPVDLLGSLTIHGVTRAVRVRAIITFDDESIWLASSFPVDIEEYRIGGLTRLFGLLRMHREVEVHLELFFTRLNGNGPSRLE